MPQTNALKHYKRSLVLTKKQKSVLIGSLLGDGTLRVGSKAVNANFKVEHGLKQKEYVAWKYNIFKNWSLTPPKISYRYKDNGDGKYEKSWWFRTVRHPKITEYRKIFYPRHRKIVPENIEDLLDVLAVAVWIMDDGSLNKNSLNISTYSFSFREVSLLLHVFDKKFSVKGKFYRDRDKGYRIYFSVSETLLLSKKISKFVIPCLAYKLPVTP